jgi:pentatricopeptide repeat protein
MDVNRAEKVDQIILEIAPNNTSVYVLLSNLYAQSGNFDKAEELRELMDKKRLKELPGLSTVEVDGKVYNFVTDDSLCSNVNEIHKELHL